MLDKTTPSIALLISSVLLLSACDDNDLNNAQTLDQKLSGVITQQNLTGNPMSGRTVVDIDTAPAQLGKKLFFSKALGGDRDSACASCHHPMLGGGDALSLSIGVGATNPELLGPGRSHATTAANYDGGPTVPRNAPTTFNIIGWDNILFHDGRVESLGKTPLSNGDDGSGIRTPDSTLGSSDAISGSNLVAAQARFPVTSPEEMKGFAHNDKDNQQMREYLAARLGGYNGISELAQSDYWLSQFRTAYNQPNASAESLITEQNIFHLIGEYERSQVFINNPWKAYVEGDSSALSTSQKQGALLFYRTIEEGGADCVSCHSGDFMSDEQHHNLAMPQIGHGKGDGADHSHDFGRFRESSNDLDRFAFRTPSLLNVEVTGPWTHAGSYTSLEAVVRHHLDPAAALANYDQSQLSQANIQNLDKLNSNTQLALGKLAMDRAAGRDVLQLVSLDDQQVTDLVAFLGALSDPCVSDRSCMSPWIADSVNDADPNGDLLIAVDQAGNPL